jgi:putative transposase
LDTIASFDDVHYSLLAACIMDNHVHILIDCSIQLENSNDYLGLDKIMKKIKGRSARYCNLHAGKSGSLWEVDSYDVLIRNDKMLLNTIDYIINNPVNAKIVETWENYEFTYLKKDYLQS